MNVFTWVISGILINAVIGAAICAYLDTKDQVFYRWYKQDPTSGILCFMVIEFWPVRAFFMLKYKCQNN